jgi:quercetin dioxygenase-like cupin family protein
MTPAPDPDFRSTPDVPAVPAQAIRRRVLERIADAEESHVTLPAMGDWLPFGRGVQIKVLNEHDGIQNYLLKLEPGASLRPHKHPVDEECVVLEGVLKVGSHITIEAGGYHLAHAGSLHATVSSETGATIFLRGAIPHIDQLLV